jgi:hypothetical protein
VKEQQKTESSNIHRVKGAGGTDPPTSPPFPVTQAIHKWKNNKKTESSNIVHRGKGVCDTDPLTSPPFPVTQAIHKWKKKYNRGMGG